MRTIRMIREVTRPGRSGPCNGQYALQKALRGAAPPWLKIGGVLRDDEIPWIWCWKDREAAAACAATDRPFIVGPNVLFEDSRRPCAGPAEREICHAECCRLMFTESKWYAQLIDRRRGPLNRAPIVLWPYPIDPKPGGPLPAEHDLLIYAKSGYGPGLISRVSRRFRRVCVLEYGRFRREALFDLARRSRCCLYLSGDDRGPLALAEILLSGCPAVGLPTGAPFIEPGRTGVLLDRFHPRQCVEAVSRCHRFERHAVAETAGRQFDTRRIVDTILASLHSAIASIRLPRR